MKTIIRLVPILLVALLVAVLSASPALAAAKGTITLNRLTASPVLFGEQVTFAVSDNLAAHPVRNQCYQDGQRVYAQWKSVQNGITGVFTLGPTPNWQSGNADCRADVVNLMNGHVLATTSYPVKDGR